MNKVTIVSPDYYKQFHCITEKCTFNCCNGSWHIDIDKQTYEKYANNEMTTPYLAYIKTNPDAVNDRKFAFVLIEKNKSCPFLNAEGLCQIQKRWGVAHLSKVCRNYPRNAKLLAGIREKSLLLSCPEVLRLALFRDQQISFVTQEYSDHIKATVANDQSSETYILRVKQLILDVLQEQGYSLDIKLYVVGYILQDFQALDQDEQDKTEMVLNCDYKMLLQQYAEPMGQKKANGWQEAWTLQVVAEIANFSFKTSDWKEFQELGAQAMAGLGLRGFRSREEINEQVIDKFTDAVRVLVLPFIASHPYWLENYLVGYIFTYFHGDKTALFTQYVRLVLVYEVTLFILTGLAAFRRECNEEMISVAIANIIRNLVQGKAILDIKINQIERKSQLNIGYVGKLIFGKDMPY
ncbi:MAG: flagellin lysine-N-methylase [Desulfosporosinus sp.]|nr:flagellin lysine-N-methylase [Desulfosporosinus sp.]